MTQACHLLPVYCHLTRASYNMINSGGILVMRILTKRKSFWNVTFLDGELTQFLFKLGDENIGHSFNICLL